MGGGACNQKLSACRAGPCQSSSMRENESRESKGIRVKFTNNCRGSNEERDSDQKGKTEILGVSVREKKKTNKKIITQGELYQVNISKILSWQVQRE